MSLIFCTSKILDFCNYLTCNKLRNFCELNCKMINNNKANLLFLVLSGFFICNVLVAEIIGGKIFSLEKVFGYDEISINLLGISDLTLAFTAGVILWPFVFVLTDIINEYYGIRGVKRITYLSIALILYAFIMIFISMALPGADFWLSIDKNMNNAYNLTLGQSLWIIIGSIIAFLIGQILDVHVFHWIKRRTGDRWVWLRANGSTLVAQLVDSFVVLFIAFGIGAGWPINKVLALCVLNYSYKAIVAILLTPLLYLIHYLIDQYLGETLSLELKQSAQE